MVTKPFKQFLTESKDLSNETLGTLRNTNLMEKGNYNGKYFVRAVPYKAGMGKLPDNEAQAMAERVVSELNDPGVELSWHEKHGPYVKVHHGSKTFNLIARLKS